MHALFIVICIYHTIAVYIAGGKDKDVEEMGLIKAFSLLDILARNCEYPHGKISVDLIYHALCRHVGSFSKLKRKVEQD